MEIRHLLTVSVLVLTTLAVGLSVASTLVRAWRASAARRRDVQLTAIRPQVLEWLATVDPHNRQVLDPTARPGRSDARSVEELIGGLLPKLRGDDRAVLTTFLERTGALERARLRMYSRRRLVRARAATLVGAAAWRRGLPEVVWLLRDPDPEVRSAAARALGRMGAPDAIPYLLGAFEAPRHSISASVVGIALLHLGPASAPELIRTLRAAPAATRTLVAETLGLMGATQASNPLCHQLRTDTEAEPRTAAAHALGRIGGRDAVGPLVAALDRRQPPALRIAAAHALGSIGDPTAIDDLALTMTDPNHRVARAAARALAALGPGGRRSLEHATTVIELGRPSALEALDLSDRVRPMVAR